MNVVQKAAPIIYLGSGTGGRDERIIGDSPAMRELRAELERLANASISVLIEGETGTGKELVAESLHRRGAAGRAPYVVFDCSAVPAALAEAELFGREAGAPPGVDIARSGAFERAHGGTIFLHEVAELPRPIQARLLRVLERGEVRRLGSAHPRSVSFRVIAATSRQLAREVQLGNFRQDLYFRLAAARIEVPPLRERVADLPSLLDHFLHELGSGKTHREVPADVFVQLHAHGWPGNVRELRNFAQRFVLSPRAPFDPQLAELATSSSGLVPLKLARREAAARFESDYLAELLRRSGGNITRAAALAQVSRQMVQKLLRRSNER